MLAAPLVAQLSDLLGGAPVKIAALAGGDINDAYVWQTAAKRRYFVKCNAALDAGGFAVEAHGLAEIAAAGALRVPAVKGWGAAGGYGYLVLEYIDASGTGDWAALGRGLAALHQKPAARYGFFFSLRLARRSARSASLFARFGVAGA